MSSANTKNKITDILTSLVSTTPEKSSSHVTCNPQSKDLFLQRVKTFTSSNWVAKPVGLSPLHCAQYGWCTEYLDQLRCVTCNATLDAGLPDEWDEAAYNEICNKVQNKLQIGHEKLCPWPDNPCPPSFLSLPSYTSEQWCAEMKLSFESLMTLRGNLPELNEDEIASLGVLDNNTIETMLNQVFKWSSENDDDALQAKVASILAICGWSVCQPVVEDPSIICTICGMEAGLWNYKSLSSRINHQKRFKTSLEYTNSQQSLTELQENMSTDVSVKSEKSETEKSDNSGQGSMLNELSRLATSSDSLAQSDLLRAAESQESLLNLRVSDSKVMATDGLDHNIETTHEDFNQLKNQFSEPRLSQATHPELMKELLLSRAPGSRSRSRYSDSIFSEVGSECFEKRLEETCEKDIEHERAITDNPPPNHPNSSQQQWMKELLFITADACHSEPTESVISEIGSVAFDRRIEDNSSLNSPRLLTPVHHGMHDYDDDSEPSRIKKMRFQVPDISMFSVIGEHRFWCPWVCSTERFTDHETSLSDSTAFISSKKIPGWKYVLYQLLPYNRPSACSTQRHEAWRYVRSTLTECISNKIT
ncbi:uncharacterized protein LOC100199404 isoform X2 [Hydra vulgaris]|uniref:Uncharacterized protein LOC100199404 isoform X2 n=1 Tax=Hydra vulgaris TaxID=6087 RepID=A0ABM4DID8_HYDVU